MAGTVNDLDLNSYGTSGGEVGRNVIVVHGDGWKEPVSTLTSLPTSGNTAGDVRMVTDTMKLYKWNGTAWSELSTIAVWGALTGTLSNQTDLQNALNAKAGSGIYVLTTTDSSLTNQTNLGALGSGFIKSSVTGGVSTISIDTNTYLTSLTGAVLTSQATPQTIGDTTNRLLKLWATDITCTNAITGSITGNAGTVTNGVYTTGADSVYLTPGTASTTYLKLDQTSPQTVINGRPVFNVGLTANDDIYGTNINYNEGLLDDPTIIDADGVAISITSVDCLIRSNSTWDGDKKLYKKTVPANETLAVTDNSINYIYVTWNSGTPIYAATTDRGVLNNSDALPVARVYMSGGNIEYQLLYEYIGRSAAIRNFDRVMRIRGSSGIERESGFGLSETATRVINIEAGSAWFGLRRITSSTLGAIAQGGAGVTSHLWYHSSGNWTSSTITQYNNTQYDNGTNLATLTSNRYAVNWVFRSITKNEIDVVLGRGDYTLAQAEASTIPPLPEAISNFYVLCGRIIVKKSSNTAYVIENVSTSTFNQATVTSHPDLSTLTWTTSGHTGTASTVAGFLASTGVAAEYTLSGTGTVLPTTVSPTFTTPILGTPTSGTLTNCTGLPISGLTASTATALGVGSIELGHASDTTITRVSPGVIAVEGARVAFASEITGTNSGTNTGDNATNTQYSGLVTNATHTGEVTGSGALTLDKTAISNKTDTTITASDVILFGDATDSGNLKTDTVQGILDLVPAGGGGDMLLGTSQAVTAEKKFTNDKITLLGSSTGKTVFHSLNDGATDYQIDFKKASGTVAYTTDITSQVEDSIVDGHTTVAPSGNAVFDGLGLKLNLSGGTLTGALNIEHADGIVLGKDETGGTPNIAGKIKMIGSGDDAYYNTFTSGDNTANATYTLPVAMPTSSGDVLSCTDAGVMSWSAVGNGDMILNSAQSVTALKTFDKDMLAMKGTSTGKNTISVANTSATSYTNTIPAKDGTFAMTTDITIDGSGTTNEITYWVDSNTLGSLAVATYPSLAELAYVKGVTGGIQSQLNAKGAGDMLLGTVQAVTAEKKFTNDKITLLGSSTGKTVFHSLNDSATDYQIDFKKASGTVAYTTDIVSQVEDNITDGHTTIAPSGNAVFDALALKANLTTPTFVTSITTPSVLATANDSGALGASGTAFSDLFLASGAVINFDAGDITLTHSSNTLTLGGGNLALGANNLTMTGSLGATGAGKLTKIWAADAEFTNLPTINGGTLATALSLGTMASETATNYVAKSLFDANTILYATSDNTPLALTVGASTIVGRKATGDIVALTGAEALAITGGAATGQTFYIGTTQVAINRSSAALTLAGITLTTPDIGTPSAGTLTNCTGLPIAGLTASTSTALGVGSIELGHASDTTITRVSAGLVAIEGSNIMTVGSTDTVTGTKTVSRVVLPSDGQILLTVPGADAKVTGFTTNSFQSGYSSSAWDLVFMGSGGKWLEADADAIATCKGLMGIAMEAKNDTEAMMVALPGSFVRYDTWNWTVGAKLYASETLGALSESIPTGADGVNKPVATAVTADCIYFLPSMHESTVVA